MNNHHSLAIKCFLEAKLKKELPSLEIITANTVMNPITRCVYCLLRFISSCLLLIDRLFDFKPMLLESDAESRERLDFLRDRKECEENINLVPIYGIIALFLLIG
jgi:hypothetical protein